MYDGLYWLLCGSIVGIINRIWSSFKSAFLHYSCRYGAAELHSVAAYMGGAAAQEVIKLITHQFVPINNTYIYNAMKQSSTTMEL